MIKNILTSEYYYGNIQIKESIWKPTVRYAANIFSGTSARWGFTAFTYAKIVIVSSLSRARGRTIIAPDSRTAPHP